MNELMQNVRHYTGFGADVDAIEKLIRDYIESALAAERKMTDKFVEWLVHTLISELDKSELAEIDAALLEYRKVRGAQETLAERD